VANNWPVKIAISFSTINRKL